MDGNSQGDKDFKEPGKQLDKNREFLPFHSDQGATDLIALLSVTAAPKGGESKWVSSLAIHNELLRQGRKVHGLPALAAILKHCCQRSQQSQSFADRQFTWCKDSAGHGAEKVS